MKKIGMILGTIALSTILLADVVSGSLYTNGVSQITQSVAVSGSTVICNLPSQINMDSLNVVGARVKSISFQNPTDLNNIVGKLVSIQGVLSEKYQVIGYNGQSAILKNMKTGQMVANITQPLNISGASSGVATQIVLDSSLESATAQVSYLVNSLSWQPIYKLVVGEKKISLEFVAKIENNSDTGYFLPKAQFIYGDISQNRNVPTDMVMMTKSQNSQNSGGFQLSDTYYSYPIQNLAIAPNSTQYITLKTDHFPVDKVLCYTLNGQNVTENVTFNTKQTLFTRSIISAFSSSGSYLGSISLQNDAENKYSIVLSKVDFVVAQTKLLFKTVVNAGKSLKQTYTVILNNKSSKNQNFELSCPLYGNNAQIIQCNYKINVISANIGVIAAVLKPGINKINFVIQTDNS
ncbi:MAG: hypothetical protein NTX05_02135 [Fusobacteria bacterium]|nr:hypothetical protein [Fusobacteriota bacterium]